MARSIDVVHLQVSVYDLLGAELFPLAALVVSARNTGFDHVSRLPDLAAVELKILSALECER